MSRIKETQKSPIQYQKRHNHRLLYQICNVIDDWGGSHEVFRGKKGQALQDLFLMGRHYGINIICCLQKLRLANTIMRTSVTLLLYWAARPRVDLDAFLEENSNIAPGGKQQLEEIYKIATVKPHGFLTLNMLTTDPSKAFMLNLEAFLVPN